jgi:predicted aminopeptidase
MWIVLLGLTIVAGCTDMQYYAQSIEGHLDLMVKRRPIEAIIEDPHTAPALRASLDRVHLIRRFASSELALPDNASYGTYVDTGRTEVLWNVFATSELDLKPLTWCFPFAGCIGYRGYFDGEAARRYARALRAQGYDVYVGPVTAYSTLGWFDDPVLNTMMVWDEAVLAGLIFHELAHQKLYIQGDTLFNESFACTVERVGVERWLATHGDEAARRAWDRQLAQRERFVGMLERTRDALDAIYQSDRTDAQKRQEKAHALAALREEYAQQRRLDPTWAAYAAWFESDLNNAKLNAVNLYEGLVPAFTALLESVDGDLPRFYAAAADLGGLQKDDRRDRLTAMVPGQPMAAAIGE